MSKMITLILTALLAPSLSHAQYSTGPEVEGKIQLVMVSQLDPAKRKHARYVRLLYTEAFERLGYKMIFKHYPPARASKLADAGEVDGELSRVFHYNSAHPALVRVEEPAFSVRFSAFATSPDIQLEGWDDLNETSYRVEYRIGSKIVHEQLTTRVPPGKLSVVTHESLGIKKLVAERTDIYVHQEEAITELLDSKEFLTELQELYSKATIHRVGVLEELTIHAFLHERHSEIAPLLSNTLKDMRAEGLFQLYDEQAQLQ